MFVEIVDNIYPDDMFLGCASDLTSKGLNKFLSFGFVKALQKVLKISKVLFSDIDFSLLHEMTLKTFTAVDSKQIYTMGDKTAEKLLDVFSTSQ